MFSDVSIQCVTLFLPTFCLLLAMLFSGIRTICCQFQQDDRRWGVRADLTALLLMYSIDSALNTIWRSNERDQKFTRLPCTG